MRARLPAPKLGASTSTSSPSTENPPPEFGRPRISSHPYLETLPPRLAGNPWC